MTRRLAVLWLVVLLCPWAVRGRAQAPAVDLAPTVILVSLDGWRWDYTQKYAASTVTRLMTRGVSATLIPSFPSKTFPNHYTIVTGLYPGHHGIVGNSVKDPATGRRLAMSNRSEVQDAMWWGGEPVWVTLARIGKASAPLFWPGSEAPIGGERARFWEPFDDGLSGNARVDRVLRWLDLPAADRPTFLTLYFSDVDAAGHDKGPDSAAVSDAVRRVDRYLERLVRGLADRRLQDRVNVVVVSDHGMGESNATRVVILDDYLPLDGIEFIDLNPTLGMFPPAGREEAVYRALAGAHPRLKVFRKAESPAAWHYRDHPRIPPIVGVVDEGWQVLRRSVWSAQVARGERGPVGVHGYDPSQAMSMRGVFVASGPAFKSGVTVPPFENVHIYDALCKALGITAAANDGDPQIARSLLR
jgi:predicted AlkP superfamily pyrophosphatase or phosphodiesterase